MKRIISLLLVMAMSVLLFVGCGKANTPIPDPTVETEEPYVHETNDRILATGVFYRTENKGFVLIDKDKGAFILKNDAEAFATFSDFSIVQIELDAMPESYPAEVSIKHGELIAQGATEEERAAIVSFMEQLKELGYEPAEVSTFISTETDLYVTPYEAIVTIVDELAKDEENMMFSPLSLNFALGMAANGVDDEFKQKFENYFGMTIEQYNAYVQQYINTATPWYSDTVVDIANSIWLRNPATLQDNYAQLMNIYYNAEVNARDFDTAFVDEVNKWCAEKTHNMIPAVLGEPPMSTALLINALYFEGKWEKGYDKEQVSEVDFTTSQGDSVSVEGMYSTEETFYMENNKATAFAKYYNDGRYAFIGILPKDKGDFTLTDLDLESLMDAGAMEYVEVHSMIPKFKFNNAHALLDLLNKVGLPVDTMSFSNITGAPLAIADVRQHTAVELDEEGTRAAAVTIVEMDGMAAPVKPQEIKEVILDRPFAFMIYDMENQTPLFVGKVGNPTL